MILVIAASFFQIATGAATIKEVMTILSVLKVTLKMIVYGGSQ
ncbi:hypothetical protein [Lactococcus cremoris]|uniref:Uncharacterized protein n=1 Tax=Lactococcus lactis subsp. cremoris TaxID=1359 RepID=A0A166JD57_LACLC|nr:hypothetical protein [Lactococcus cremoris]KZK06025.1 hypothetical protein AB996_1590 [Lactococcus cremoris]MDR9868440.1 hypothetical protein [Lactococcus cremoris]WMX71966.1 hypothetical protein RF668_03995 [Lactococcus cremoris]